MQNPFVCLRPLNPCRVFASAQVPKAWNTALKVCGPRTWERPKEVLSAAHLVAFFVLWDSSFFFFLDLESRSRIFFCVFVAYLLECANRG